MITGMTNFERRVYNEIRKQRVGKVDRTELYDLCKMLYLQYGAAPTAMQIQINVADYYDVD